MVGGSVSSSHGTGAGSLDTATVSGGYDVAALLTARLRWARTGLRDGVGKASWADGTVYEGAFKADKREGKGKLTQPDGFSYEGDWAAGEMQGQGLAVYPSGDRYEGAFVKGKRQGPGKLTYKNGETSEGVWENGILKAPLPAAAAPTAP